MKQESIFMMIFKFNPNFSNKLSKAEEMKMYNAWSEFIGELTIKEKLLSTHRLGFEGVQVNSDLSTINEISIVEERSISGNMIVRANTIEEAVQMAKNSPILKMDGGTVEIRNILPIQ